VREHSQLKRASHKLLWVIRPGRQGSAATNISGSMPRSSWMIMPPSKQFGEDKAFDYFKDVYSSTPHTFNQPDWIPIPQAPTKELSCDEINTGELQTAIKHTKSTSSLSPFD